MARTISIRLNKDQLMDVCKKFKITEDEIGRTTKTLLISDKVGFEQFKEVGSSDDTVEDLTIDEVEVKSKEWSTNKLKKELGITPRNRQNKIDQKGLYGEKNLRRYLLKVSNEVNIMDKGQEILASISLFIKEEILATELSRRIKI